jgi:hypothetical protein
MPRGPVPRGEYAGKSSVFSTRIRPDLRQKLEQGAKQSGRSLSQEIEHRLRRSFVEDEKISETFGDRRTFLIMKMIAMGIHLPRIREEAEVSWLDDPYYFDLSIGTALSILEAIRPKGEVKLPENEIVALVTEARAEGTAQSLWGKVLRSDPALPITKGSNLEHWFAMAKADLGNIPDRAERTVHNYWDAAFSQPQPKKKRKRKT